MSERQHPISLATRFDSADSREFLCTCCASFVLAISHVHHAEVNDMVYRPDLVYRPGKLSEEEVLIRSCFCTTHQLSELKSSKEFQQWSQQHRQDTRRAQGPSRKPVHTTSLLAVLLCSSLLLLALILGRPQVSLPVMHLCARLQVFDCNEVSEFCRGPAR